MTAIESAEQLSAPFAPAIPCDWLTYIGAMRTAGAWYGGAPMHAAMSTRDTDKSLRMCTSPPACRERSWPFVKWLDVRWRCDALHPARGDTTHEHIEEWCEDET